jgi:alpha-beta hydrolase superfamily lysophospholipase
MGESMGGAIVVSLANQNKTLPIEGVVLVAPAIWNFTEENFFKSKTMKFISKLLPNLKIEGKNWVKVKASDNQDMLKELSEDKFFIHKPSLSSLYGIIQLMDESYSNAYEYFSNASYETLILVPIKDEIVPRKPLIKLFETLINSKKLDNKINLMVFENSYHMMLRDINGAIISSEIVNWISRKNKNKFLDTSSYGIEILKKSDYHHFLEK